MQVTAKNSFGVLRSCGSLTALFCQSHLDLAVDSLESQNASGVSELGFNFLCLVEGCNSWGPLKWLGGRWDLVVDLIVDLVVVDLVVVDLVVVDLVVVDLIVVDLVVVHLVVQWWREIIIVILISVDSG